MSSQLDPNRVLKQLKIKAMFLGDIFDFANNVVYTITEKDYQNDVLVLDRIDFSEAVLTNFDFKEAWILNCNFFNADLSGADFTSAVIRNTDMTNCTFKDAKFTSAILFNVNLSFTWLNPCNFDKATLKVVNFAEAAIGANTSFIGTFIGPNVSNLTINCPEEGEFIGYKMCTSGIYGKQGILVKLLILADAKRSSATSLKCRASKVKVLEIEGADVAYSSHDNKFAYRVGEVLEIENFDENRWNECAPGIHFFMNKEVARCYGR